MIVPTGLSLSLYLIFESGQPACKFSLSEGKIRLNLTRGQPLMSSPELGEVFLVNYFLFWVVDSSLNIDLYN